jgi:hypothetical protein
VAEATAYVTDLARKRGLDSEVCAEALLSLLLIVQVVENSVLVLRRLGRRVRATT